MIATVGRMRARLLSWLLVGPLLVPFASASSLTREEVALLNKNGICPIEQLTFSISETLEQKTANSVEPVAAQWSGQILMKEHPSIERYGPRGWGLLSIADVNLFCTARTLEGGVLQEKKGGVWLNPHTLNDINGNGWLWTYDHPTRTLKLVPQLASDAGAPAGYRFSIVNGELFLTKLMGPAALRQALTEAKNPRIHSSTLGQKLRESGERLLEKLRSPF